MKNARQIRLSTHITMAAVITLSCVIPVTHSLGAEPSGLVTESTAEKKVILTAGKTYTDIAAATRDLGLAHILACLAVVNASKELIEFKAFPFNDDNILKIVKATGATTVYDADQITADVVFTSMLGKGIHAPNDETEPMRFLKSVDPSTDVKVTNLSPHVIHVAGSQPPIELYPEIDLYLWPDDNSVTVIQGTWQPTGSGATVQRQCYECATPMNCESQLSSVGVWSYLTIPECDDHFTEPCFADWQTTTFKFGNPELPETEHRTIAW